ncbi:hypothetical protein LINGRAHAP2_LOCUS8244 [Linum grandiflorum]
MFIIYSPYEETSPFQPWPPPEPPTVGPSRESVVQLTQRFMTLSGVERSKKMFNQYEYLREVIMKAEEKQSRELKKIHDMELAILMDEVRYGKGTEGLDMEQRRSLAWLLKGKIQDVQRRMQFLGATQGVEAHDSSLQGLNQIVRETANDPIHFDENKGSSSLLDRFENSDDEYEDVDLELSSFLTEIGMCVLRTPIVKETVLWMPLPITGTLFPSIGMFIIYSPYEEPSPFQPWPPPEPPTVGPSRESVVQLTQRFMTLSGVERSKKMFNQYEYLREVIMKEEEKQSRELKKIHDMELAILMDEVRYGKGTEGLDMEQRRSLAWLLKGKIQDVQRRMQFLGATQGVEAHDSSLQGLNQIVRETANDPIHFDEKKGSSALLDRFENSDDEYEGVDLEVKLYELGESDQS